MPEGVSSLKPDRDVTGDGTISDPELHNLTATWFGPGSPQLDHRIALYVKVSATQNVWEWIVFPGADPAQPDIERATTLRDDAGAKWGQWSSEAYNLNADPNTTNWVDDDTGASYTIGLDELKAASHLRIDTRVNGGDWVKGLTPAAIPSGS